MKVPIRPFCLLLTVFISIGCDKNNGPIGSGTWNCGKPVAYDGKLYKTVQIGNQCWFNENLNVGIMILGSDTVKNNSIIEKYCFDDSLENCDTYGGLYEWNEAMQYSNIEGVRGICPPGWHISTDTEFQILSTTVSNDGNALKAIGQGIGNGAGTNSSGFSALLAGWRDYDGSFYDFLQHTAVWSSTEVGLTAAHTLCLYYSHNLLGLGSYGKAAGFSVRCIKD
jgi:uncharacterized protein (TIGR02145 family)